MQGKEKETDRGMDGWGGEEESQLRWSDEGRMREVRSESDFGIIKSRLMLLLDFFPIFVGVEVVVGEPGLRQGHDAF